MQVTDIFLLQFVLSLFVFGFLAHAKLRPLLAKLDWADVVFWLAVPHAVRHIGLVFLVPGVVSPDLPADFAASTGYGDLITAVLGATTVLAAQYRLPVMVPLAWLLTIVGTADLAIALPRTDAAPLLNAAWYIPTFLVPILLITHAMMFFRLVGLAPRGRRTNPAH